MARPVAVVTGASAGVGRATARAFAERGFDLGLLARGSAGLEGAANEVASCGSRALLAPVDISEFDEVDAAAARIEEELGSIDVWINDAMTTVFAPLAQTRPADFRRAVDVTFLGQVWGTIAALSRMRPRDRGTILNVGSALSFVGIPSSPPTARRSSPAEGSSSRLGPSSSMTEAASGCPWCTCRR